MSFLKYDLHTHTTASDGHLTPVELYHRADEQNIKTLAITDHDCVNGIRDLIELQNRNAINNHIKLIPGTELTCLINKQVLHVVALNISLDCPKLLLYLEKLKRLRIERAIKISEKLQKYKLPNILPDVLALVDGGQIGRPHFAKVLTDKGFAASEAAAFNKYLGAGKGANVKVQWPELEETLSVISQAGGISIIAHPTKYKLTMSKLRKVIAEFKGLGGDGIEISYPGITKEQQNIIKFEAKKHDLMVSAGSDFHTPINKWVELGKYPDLPESIPHVLNCYCG